MTTMNNGSLQNHLMSNSTSTTPVVGMGATEICWTDRHAYTVIEVVSPKEIVVQRDKVTRTDENGMSDCQDYSFEADPSATKETLVLKTSKKRPQGVWVRKGESINSVRFNVGRRDEYHDYSF